MPAVPLGLRAYKRTDSFAPEAVLKNMLLEKDDSGLSSDGTIRVQRPGLQALATLPDSIRGLLYRSQTGDRIAVAGSQIYDNEVASGTIDGLGIAPLTVTAFAVGILGGTQPYLYDGTVTAFDVYDGHVAQDLDQLNGYILTLCTSGRFYWLLPGETLIDPLDFATAESSPDGGVAIRRVGDEFVILGTDSGEVWQSTGDGDAPFQRVSGRPIERGCLARDTVRRFDNSLVWVADDFTVVRLGPVAQVISNPGLSQRIRQRTGELSAWVLSVDGHKIYCLRIPGQGVFGFDASTQNWSEFASPGLADWYPHVGYETQGVVVGGSWNDGKIYQVTPAAANDDGVAFERVLTGTVPIRGVSPRNDSFSIGVGASADCTVKIRYKDGQDEFPDYYDELEVRAPLDVATMYRLGMPDQPYRTFEASVTDDVRVSIFGAMANEGWS